MRNLKIIVEYDGTNFCGWQIQKDCRSVQGELKAAVYQITGEEVTVEGAGRTDSGVHARGQVANFRIAKSIGTFEFTKGLNAVLPEDVRIKSMEEVDESFHARFSAKERRYKYYIIQQPTALHRMHAWYYPHTLDLEVMREGCRQILGEHDFKSFCLVQAEVNHHRCEVRKADWYDEGTFRIFEIHANRFVHSMVRALVGTFVRLGNGKLSLEDLQHILEERDRRTAGFAAPAHGLYLEEVIY
ncbi:MAG: tRNA pseudouridine(38-40) synthase TruA [Bacteroidetes bacterium]|nr:tRNA pseudouridine(38-40) synthase TruA [Bacteroidota bacterium]